MTQPSTPPASADWLMRAALILGVAVLVGLAAYAFRNGAPADYAFASGGQSEGPKSEGPKSDDQEAPRQPIPAPELDGGIAWLNTAGPIRIKDLRGKIVVLDFWTYCCINCIHTLPDLAKLEKKYANEVVVIGVHSAKFDNEKNTDSIRKAILRYEIKHPVVNDSRMLIWDRYQAHSWPTLVLIDPEGNLVATGSGEGLYDALDAAVAKLVKTHKEKKTLNDKPLKFELAREAGDSPLFFPGKILADAAGNRLFIADSTHHRIVITDLDGKKIDVAGVGVPGMQDGPFAAARFNDPQGMALRGDTLFVADRKNHLLRALDLKARTVRTVAGTGKQGQQRDAFGDALKVGLNSPWDLLLHGDRLFIAQAGFHQIWALDLAKNELAPYAGTGRENIVDGPLDFANFAQPSGLTTDGKKLYVADSEVSAIRWLALDGSGDVHTLVGEHLFKFGDVSTSRARQLALGVVDNLVPARLQHALGVVYHDGKLYVADTYNSKIKVLAPATKRVTELVGGDEAGWLAQPVFNEPAGISYANGKLYVADTNAHRIRVVDLKTRAVSTLKLQGVTAPKPAP